MPKVYVICPYGLITGGPDALHQMVYYLNEIGIEAKLVYSDIKSHKYEIPNQYKKYINEYLLLNDIIDECNSAIVVPETENHILNNYSRAKKYIWWLSVDNDINSSGFKNKLLKIIKKVRLKNLKKLYKINTLKIVLKHKEFNFNNNQNIEHLCASYYSYNYILQKLKDESKIHYCIEPISKIFLEKSYFSIQDKSDIILYNPKKNIEFTNKIINFNRSKALKFIALSGYSQDELIALYQKAKIYIDFGFFPGAERIPKEAVINGCCIITGKYGASNYYSDVPILDEYKIDAIDKNIPHICNKIDEIINLYGKKINDFEEYRNTVWNLENNFIIQLKEIFK